MPKLFQFKQFTIDQEKSAMKIGTDGVLLGSWVQIEPKTESILDIGSGTGLIALMMAQRSNALQIDAIELEAKAYIQSVENFERSEWGDRLFCYHTSLQEFAEEIEDTYDLIVSNPPFYIDTYKELIKERAMARHTHSLSHRDLLLGVSKLLSKNGSCAFIIPYAQEHNFIEEAKAKKLFPIRITRVKGNENTLIKRSLMQFSFHQREIEIDELIIEKERHVYTADYIDLVKDFYLKM